MTTATFFRSTLATLACCFFSSVIPSISTPLAAQEATAAAASDAQAEFDQVFQDWKQLLDKMRRMQVEAREAEDEALPGIKEEYAAMIKEGEAMVPKLRDAAIAVYQEAPNEDRQITRWLVSIATDFVNSDNFAAAQPAIDALMAGKTPDPAILDAAARTAFASHEFEKAKEYFQQAAGAGSLSDQGAGMMASVDDYIEYWKEESKLREAEANAEEGQELPRVKMETSEGDLVIELFENEAPETVGNFVSLVEKGFYDGLTFHRVLPGFMAQGGCPEGTGSGGPGYEIYCESHQPNHRKHFTGSLSMAHAGRDTGGSQFFLTFVPTPHLNEQHTVFGRVVEGLDILPKLERRDPSSAEGMATTPSRIIKAEVIRKRDHKYQPNKVQ